MLNQKQYISVDIEHTGASGNESGSIVSLGACVVWKIDNAFYTELKPINNWFNTQALKVGAKNLLCLGEKLNRSPEEIMSILKIRWTEPEEALKEYWLWLNGLKQSPIEAAAPIKFDGWLMAEYHRLCNKKNPLWHSWEDINSLLRWFVNDTSVGIKKLWIRDWDLPHNALRDAQIQAIEMEVVLQMMKVNQDTKWEITKFLLDTKNGNKLKHLHFHHQTHHIFNWAKRTIQLITQTPIEEELPIEALKTINI